MYITMKDSVQEAQDRQQAVDITSIQKDVEYIKENMDKNFQDHAEIKKIFKEGLERKVGNSRFKPVEMIAYGLVGIVLVSMVNQLLELVQTAKALL